MQDWQINNISLHTHTHTHTHTTWKRALWLYNRYKEMWRKCRGCYNVTQQHWKRLLKGWTLAAANNSLWTITTCMNSPGKRLSAVTLLNIRSMKSELLLEKRISLTHSSRPYSDRLTINSTAHLQPNAERSKSYCCAKSDTCDLLWFFKTDPTICSTILHIDFNFHALMALLHPTVLMCWQISPFGH
jgi:hypothetical protein